MVHRHENDPGVVVVLVVGIDGIDGYVRWKYAKGV
jgi:hypothetical protein